MREHGATDCGNEDKPVGLMFWSNAGDGCSLAAARRNQCPPPLAPAPPPPLPPPPVPLPLPLLPLPLEPPCPIPLVAPLVVLPLFERPWPLEFVLRPLVALLPGLLEPGPPAFPAGVGLPEQPASKRAVPN